MSATPPPKALVIEDEANIRDFVCLHLRLEGFACVPADDGQQGLRAAADTPFDLIVLDIMLPGLDGISLCRANPASFEEPRHADPRRAG
ncbi:MAG: response regulator [Acidobacteria bacterium]|nr:response regulator [Acidobacteriota bacterium]